MALVPTGELVAEARAAGRCCPAFNVIQLEHATAIVAAAEELDQPVVLQVSHNAVRYHGALEPLGAAMLAAAGAARTPVGVHLDHAETFELVARAVALGFPSVMFDASALEHHDNVRATARTARYCHDNGVWVEAELGRIGGKDGVHAPGARTDPAEAVEFVRDTGVDALAVAVGTSHAMRTRDADLDFGLVERLRAALDVPLVLHGSSGVADADLRTAVRAGLTKINIATRLNEEFTAAVRRSLADHPDGVDPRRYLGAGREAITRETARLLAALNGAGEPATTAP
ncbi:class II fructose-bisphosphate aldolase [Saccharopolyspora sp. CA-218241]|uniref:class II fructose-bisphosphate aldolase n=1 Tax=Saccharopolyspora sp. CA-218241 TaxID=3240027 RepID=UPI003D96F2EB